MRAFPRLVPVTPDDPATPANRAAWAILEQWHKPFVTAFSSGDPITRGGDRYLQKRIPGAQGRPHVTLRGGHFLQEDSPAEFAAAVLAAVQSVVTRDIAAQAAAKGVAGPQVGALIHQARVEAVAQWLQPRSDVA